jgi:hypothetical protein
MAVYQYIANFQPKLHTYLLDQRSHHLKLIPTILFFNYINYFVAKLDTHSLHQI